MEHDNCTCITGTYNNIEHRANLISSGLSIGAFFAALLGISLIMAGISHTAHEIAQWADDISLRQVVQAVAVIAGCIIGLLVALIFSISSLARWVTDKESTYLYRSGQTIRRAVLRVLATRHIVKNAPTYLASQGIREVSTEVLKEIEQEHHETLVSDPVFSEVYSEALKDAYLTLLKRGALRQDEKKPNVYYLTTMN